MWQLLLSNEDATKNPFKKSFISSIGIFFCFSQSVIMAKKQNQNKHGIQIQTK